jgi:hypothetical protein
LASNAQNVHATYNQAIGYDELEKMFIIWHVSLVKAVNGSYLPAKSSLYKTIKYYAKHIIVNRLMVKVVVIY